MKKEELLIKTIFNVLKKILILLVQPLLVLSTVWI